MNNIQIFGYGSLLNLESVQATTPGVEVLIPSYIQGFRRDFSLWDAVGFTETNSDVAGTPYCAVDVNTVEDAASRVNGVLFSVDENYFNALVKREHDYRVIKVPVFDFHTDQPLGECFVFSASKYNGDFNFDDATQMRYLEVCLDGAKSHGEMFYTEFIANTHIGDKPLTAFPEIISAALRHDSQIATT